MSDLTFLSAAEMAAHVRDKKLSPVELVEAHLAKIENLNPILNAFVQVDAERALRAAKEAESAVKRSAPMGALHGVPLSIKSSFNVDGFRCEAGTRLRAGFVARQDAPLVTRLKNAGAIILGTTNTPELLMAWETDNLLYGRTNSPWDLQEWGATEEDQFVSPHTSPGFAD
jgi:amidase